MQVSPYTITTPNPFAKATHGIARSEMESTFSVKFLTEVDLSNIEALRAETKVSYTALLAKAVSVALGENMYANSRLYRSMWPPFRLRHQFFASADVTVAVEKDVENAHQAVFIDVIRNPANRSLEEVTAEIRALQNATEHNNAQWKKYAWIVTRLPAFLAKLLLTLPRFLPNLWHQYRGAAAFISSPGKYGVDAILATWTAPLGFSYGFIKDRPIVKEGKLTVARTTFLTMDFDRRIIAGAEAARLCRRIVNLLEDPQQMLEASSETNAGTNGHCEI